MVRPAARAEGEGQAPAPGKLTFEDEVGNVRTCSYALDQVPPSDGRHRAGHVAGTLVCSSILQ